MNPTKTESPARTMRPMRQALSPAEAIERVMRDEVKIVVPAADVRTVIHRPTDTILGIVSVEVQRGPLGGDVTTFYGFNHEQVAASSTIVPQHSAGNACDKRSDAVEQIVRDALGFGMCETAVI